MVLKLAAGPGKGCRSPGAVLLDGAEVVWVQPRGDWGILSDLCLMKGAGAVMTGLQGSAVAERCPECFMYPCKRNQEVCCPLAGPVTRMASEPCFTRQRETKIADT